MLLAKKIRLKPTAEQEIQFRKSAGTARFAGNYFVRRNEEHYKEHKKFLLDGDIRKELTQLKKQPEYAWLQEISANVVKQAVKDKCGALQRFLADMTSNGFPSINKKGKTAPSFYVNYESLKRVRHGFIGEKLGYVLTTEPLPKLANGEKYKNPRITFDGKFWFLSVAIEVPTIQQDLTDNIVGIDVGIKELAVTSDGVVYENINHSKEVKRLKKALKREQRSAARMLEKNTESKGKNAHLSDGQGKPKYKKPLHECKNFQKSKKKQGRIHRRLKNIRTNHLHQTTAEIVKTKPFRIVMENLNIKGMLKNKHLAKAISEQKLYEFRRQIQYKCQLHGIEFILADRFYPSSKICSKCGAKKANLKLNDRVFRCDCGHTQNRDLNAALNLAKYVAQ
ncbi:MAG: transposase [Defluviitaleaceae bacterium]|nr:transposase [Defluviitaleaceae bacterium]